MSTYKDYGQEQWLRVQDMLVRKGLSGLPTSYEEFMKLDHRLRKLVASEMPLIHSDNYEHFMARLPGKKFAAQHLLFRKQIGGFTVAAGFWKWLEFLSHQMTRDEVLLTDDFFKGKHNSFPRQFDKDYWLHVVDDYDGYPPLQIRYIGEGAVVTGVPFPVAEVYGEKPAVWLNEPMYIQLGQLSHVATIAAQFSEILGDPWRFIEVAFRALQNKEFSDDMLLAMLIGGGIISTSNDFGAFINGAPFKCSGTTGHCYYQQYPKLEQALRALLESPLGPYSTVLLDAYKHEHGFQILQKLIEEGLPAPFAERPDSGDTLDLGMHDLTVLQDSGKEINVVFEDGYTPIDVKKAERVRKQYGLDEARALYGAGSGFLGARRMLEAAYKACYFHDGTVLDPINIVETMKICLNDPMKQSISGRVSWFENHKTGIYMLGTFNEEPPRGYFKVGKILYDGLTNPGKPYFNPDYNPDNLTLCKAIQAGKEESESKRKLLGPSFTHEISECKPRVAMTPSLRKKRKQLYQTALDIVAKTA